MQKYFYIGSYCQASRVYGHVPNEAEGNLCRYGFPQSSRHAGILPNAQREEKSNRTPHTPWRNRAEMGVRLFKKFLSALVDTASKNLDQTTLAQITPTQLMRKAATVRNTQITLSGKTPVELAMGRTPRDLLDPASMNPEQLTSTPTKQDLLNEEIQNEPCRLIWSTTTRRQPPRSCWTHEVCSSRSLSRRKCVLLDKKIRAKSSKDGHLANGWRLKLLPSRAPWQL